MSLKRRHLVWTAGLLAFSLVGGCVPDIGTPDYSGQVGLREPVDPFPPVPPDPYQPGDDRLSVGYFYEGGRSDTIPINTVTTNYFIFVVDQNRPGQTLTGSQFPSSDRLEGLISIEFSTTDQPFWGAGILWGEAIDLSEWTTMYVGFKSSDESFERFDLTLQSAATIPNEPPPDPRSVVLDPRNYGYTNDGQWHFLRIPLQDAIDLGWDLSNVRSPFIISAPTRQVGDQMLIDNLYFTKEDSAGAGGAGGTAGSGGTGGGGTGGELRPLPDIYTTGNAINYSPYRAGGPGAGEVPSDADILEDLGLLQTVGYDLLRLFGGDAVSEKILQLAEANFPEMRFQQGLFLEGLAPGPPADNCDSMVNDSQVETAIRLANTYSNVVTVSVGNETSFFAGFMPLNCLEGYITETRSNVTQPVTADDDYTFYANFFGRSPDGVLRLIDFVSIHMYPFLNYQQWDWKQEGVAAGPLRAAAMMNASLAKAQDNYQAVYDYPYNASTIGESLPIVVGETGWKWRQTTPSQEIETYAALPVNAKWYNDLMLTWERSPGGPVTIFPFEAFDEAWKTTDDGWGFWDEDRMPNYVLCGTPAGSPCNDPLYEDAGYYTP